MARASKVGTRAATNHRKGTKVARDLRGRKASNQGKKAAMGKRVQRYYFH